MKFFLGTHEPTWIGRSPVPLFVSMARGPRKFGQRPALAGWACDSGGFTQLHRGGWVKPPEQFLEEVYFLADKCPGMEWASPQDWMCEPTALAATGKTVRYHQMRTIENYLLLKELDDRDLIIPVIQGLVPGDHATCVELYMLNGVDLTKVRLAGVGTICRREALDDIRIVIEELAGLGIPLHGFGVKMQGLQKYGKYLTSADSLAWSAYARHKAGNGYPPFCGSPTHKSCQNCFEWAHLWRERVLTDL